MREWLNRPVSKTGIPHRGIEGSNPSPSAQTEAGHYVPAFSIYLLQHPQLDEPESQLAWCESGLSQRLIRLWRRIGRSLKPEYRLAVSRVPRPTAFENQCKVERAGNPSPSAQTKSPAKLVRGFFILVHKGSCIPVLASFESMVRLRNISDTSNVSDTQSNWLVP